MNILTFVRTMLLLLSTAGMAHAGTNHVVRHEHLETSGATQVDARICRLDLPAQGCAILSGWSGHMEQTLTLPSAGTYMLAWTDRGRAGHNAGPAAYEVSFGGVRLGEPAPSPGSQNHRITFSSSESGVLSFKVLQSDASSSAVIENAPVTESVPEPGMYAMLMIGLCLLAFTSRTRGTEKFD